MIFYTSEAKVTYQMPLVWSLSELDKIKECMTANDSVEYMLKVADSYCQMEPISLIEKKQLTFEPNVHYFCSTGRYWWPDLENKDIYINIDGKSNPESWQYDRRRLSELAKRCQSLSKAYYVTHDNKYYNAFIHQIKTWFIYADTYMYPNFDYASVVPGYNNNKGRPAGIVYAYDFNIVLESVRLVNCVKRID